MSIYISGSRNLPDQLAQDASSETSSTSLPESSTDVPTTVKPEEPPKKQEAPTQLEELIAFDSKQSSSESLTEENQSQNTTPEVNIETTTSK